MRIRFSIFCRTQWGRHVCVLGSLREMGAFDPDQAVEMSYSPEDVWKTEILVEEGAMERFEYTYVIKSEAGNVLREEAAKRSFSPDTPDMRGTDVLEFQDTWMSPSDPDLLLLTAAFTDAIFRRDAPGAENLPPADGNGRERQEGSTAVRLRLVNPRVRAGDTVAVVGSNGPLGEWDSARAASMDPGRFPVWTYDMPQGAGDAPFDYRYVIRDKAGVVTAYEEGPDRRFEPPDGAGTRDGSRLMVVTDNKFRYRRKWRGAGIAVPVFSLRSERGFGVGELLDLKDVVDWVCASGFQVIQMLPINDTSTFMGKMDSVPYSCVSVFALHPLYLNLEAMGSLPEGIEDEIARHRPRLNGSASVQYEEVMRLKLSLLRRIFENRRETFLSSPEFQSFIEEHGYWLRPYAAFCALRDHFQTTDFLEWGQFSRITEEGIAALTTAGSEHFEAVAFYFFIQYHLHLQLSEASRYASKNGVVLKGDIPIGIQKRSDSCWVSPGLFHMDQSAGAPPDSFSDAGQNWGFPTYNWDEMAKDNYAWWRRRMGHMSGYFQMVRLDHVLGFFRVWEIPDEFYSGVMGHFNPALPLWKEELEKEGIWDFRRLSEPYIPHWLVKTIFGREAEAVASEFLEQSKPDHYRLKPEFSTERLAASRLGKGAGVSERVRIRREMLRSGLFTLISNVCLFRDPQWEGFHPRFNMQDTASFACLEGWMREKLDHLYYDYFYHRQEQFWQEQAMVKLPVLKKVSRMLICGEDLGMIPQCVPKVMEELCLLGLRIQRMPGEADREFGLPSEYPYLTVSTTSSHDLPTLRGWWEEDRERTARYYHTVLGRDGEPPYACEPDLCEEIIRQHLESPSMWAIFPIQDILAMSGELRRPGDPAEERINNPADPYQVWNFRLHIPTERLLGEEGFNAALRRLVDDSGRAIPIDQREAVREFGVTVRSRDGEA